MSRGTQFTAALILTGAALLLTSCANIMDDAALLGALVDRPDLIRCGVVATPASDALWVVNATGGLIDIPGGHQLSVPARALPVERARFEYRVPATPYVVLALYAFDEEDEPIRAFRMPLSLTMSHGGRACTTSNGSPLVPDRLQIGQRSADGDWRTASRTATTATTVTADVRSFSTFAIAH